MGITTEVSDDQGIITIHIKGLFNASLHREFRNAYKDRVVTPGRTQFIVDLTHTEYMDSAALGMLLLLHEYAGGGNVAKVTIQGAKKNLRDILEIAKFDRLFTII